MTSHDVVSRVRRAVGERRVGHAGTLDPAATGVLVVGIGQATKLLGLLTLDRKGYRATFQLGAETATDDAEGEVTATSEVPDELLAGRRPWREVQALVGWHDQVPPRYSAVSVGGRRAYDAARAGEDVELAARRIRIYDARCCGVDPEAHTWELDLDVSKGTYVRSIARDLGRELGCLAHVSELTRTFAGPVTLGDCVSLAELEAGGADLVRERCLDPAAVLGLAARELSLDEIADVANGRRISLGTVRRGVVSREPVQGERVALTLGGGLAGIWRRDGRRLVCETNFPQAIEGVRDVPLPSELSPERSLAPHAEEALLRDALGCCGGPSSLGSCDVSLLGGVVTGWTSLQGHLSLEPAAPGEDPRLMRRFSAGCDRFVCAIGAFDGLHRGHRALIARARAEADARGANLMVVTFTPDPARVLGGEGAPCDLLLADERPALIQSSWDVDAVLVVNFTPQVAALPYERFVREVLGAYCSVAALVVGEDFCLGAGGAGTVPALSALGEKDSFSVTGVPLMRDGGAPITATRIRRLLSEGRVEGAASLLGRCHRVLGTVEHGRGEGTGFGFPTANVRVADGLALPAEGVYAGFVDVGPAPGESERRAYPAAINVGRPRSFSPGGALRPSDSMHVCPNRPENATDLAERACCAARTGGEGGFLEATLLGFEGNLYGRDVRVTFVRWLRAPRSFDSVEELERTVLSNVDWVRRTLGEKGIVLERVPDFSLAELVARSRGEVAS